MIVCSTIFQTTRNIIRQGVFSIAFECETLHSCVRVICSHTVGAKKVT